MASDPGQAAQLDGHENGLATNKEFVQGGVFDQGAAELIEDLQSGAGLACGVLAPTAQLGHAGGALFQEDVEQAVGQGQADAFGLRYGSELGLLVGIDNDGLAQLVVALP